jgi:hypothetical protein
VGGVAKWFSESSVYPPFFINELLDFYNHGDRAEGDASPSPSLQDSLPKKEVFKEI